MVKKKGSKSDDADYDQLRSPEVQDDLAFTNDVEETRNTGVNEKGKEFTKIILHIPMLCGFPEDSLMLEVIKQEGWTKLEDITLIAVDEVKDLRLLREDGMHLGCPMMVHICMLKAFLLYYKRRSRRRTFPQCWNTRDSASTSIVVRTCIPMMLAQVDCRQRAWQKRLLNPTVVKVIR
jgi:hypothetical protein